MDFESLKQKEHRESYNLEKLERLDDLKSLRQKEHKEKYNCEKTEKTKKTENKS
jgi:hypothetical protein